MSWLMPSAKTHRDPLNHLVTISSVHRVIEFEDEIRKTCWRGVGVGFLVDDGF